MLKPKVDNNDKILKTLREIVATGGNRQCFDCNQKGVTYVNMTTGSFVCTSCSGILRGLTPPHRVKSISMAKFTSEELDFIKAHGNDECSKTWLGLWDSQRTIRQDHRDFMIDKYEKKRYYLEAASPLKSIKPQSQQYQTPQTNEIGKSNKEESNLKLFKFVNIAPPASKVRNSHQENHQQNGKIIGPPTNFEPQNFFFDHENNLNENKIAGNFNSNSARKNVDISNSDRFKIDTSPNFADFENNQIYNAADECYEKNEQNNNNSKSNTAVEWNFWQQCQCQWPNQPENRWSLPIGSFNNSQLEFSAGSFNSHSQLNSTSSTADRYAALKDLDEQLREAKTSDVTLKTEPSVPVNPFSNVYQFGQQSQQEEQSRHQSYQNWIIPESSNGVSNGFYYKENMTNGNISQTSPFGKAGIENPFVTSPSANNPFL